MKNSPLYQMQPSTECCTVVSSCSRFLISICFLLYRFPPSKCQYSMPAEYNQPSLDYFNSVLPSFIFKFHHLQRFFVYLGNLQVFLLGINSAAMATKVCLHNWYRDGNLEKWADSMQFTSIWISQTVSKQETFHVSCLREDLNVMLRKDKHIYVFPYY